METNKTEEEKVYTFEDVRKHNTSESGWAAIHGNVYDLTKFIPQHPGGAVIQTSLGRDATILFEIHHNLLEESRNQKFARF
jgi:cytochrome b involved in lipid metabolism